MRIVTGAEALLREAERLRMQGNLASARARCDEALRVQPRHAGALNLAGIISAMSGDYRQAAVLFAKATAADPADPVARNNHGLALQRLGRLNEALDRLAGALELRPGYAEALFNRGNVLRELGQLEAALAAYDAAVDTDPGHAEALCNRGVVLSDLHRFTAALDSFARALALRPDYAKAHCNRAYTALLCGDLASGLPAYEWRWRLPQPPAPGRRDFPQPCWLGAEPLAGRTLLVHAEQGFGDTLQFCRYVEVLARRGARVLVEVQKPLVRLLRSLAGASGVHARGDPLPQFDYHCPMLSLPLALGTTLDTIPARDAYIRVPDDSLSAWQSRLGRPAAPRLGLGWSGSATNSNDHRRSIALAELEPLLPDGWEVFGLQKDVRAVDRRTLKSLPQVQNLGTELADFCDTAAACQCLDVVVTVDTAVAHLSAAIGRPTWILLPFNPDWRWLVGRGDSPWYPGVRLYRQDAPGDWSGVLARVRADLARFGEGRTVSH